MAVARRYARALADVAGEADPSRLEAIAAEIEAVAAALRRVEGAVRFFEDPGIGRAAKEKTIEALGKKAGVSDLTRRFLRVLTDHRRIAALPAIARSFAGIKNERLGVVPAAATTAVPMSEAESRRFRESLQTMTGRRVRLSLEVDPAVLGGVRTRIGSRVYDGTLRRQLEILRGRLAAR
jgi:F-type H+-transporting ATPase subunit delta